MSTIDGRVRDSRMAHRYRFLSAVHKLVPEVLADLERDVLPHFRAMFRDTYAMEPGETCTFVFSESGESTARLWITWPSSKLARQKEEIWVGPSWATDIRGVELDSAGLKFLEAMEKWAGGHSLCSESILGDAFSTLLFWLVNPFCKRVWLPPGASWTPDELSNVPKLHIEDTWSFEPWPAVARMPVSS